MNATPTSQPPVLNEAVDTSKPDDSLRGDMPNGFNPLEISTLTPPRNNTSRGAYGCSVRRIASSTPSR